MDRISGGKVAIKKVSKSKLENDLLLTEYEILQKLDHPNIRKILDILEDSSYYFIITEYKKKQYIYSKFFF